MSLSHDSPGSAAPQEVASRFLPSYERELERAVEIARRSSTSAAAIPHRFAASPRVCTPSEWMHSHQISSGAGPRESITTIARWTC